ncbi:MAG: hypothetical protein MUC32_11325, partial [Burkholderiaceae bacterium]|nr:hypothetical protein [Burkholderiaceae bacterium]
RWLRESSVFVLVRGLVGNTSLRAYSGVMSDPPLAAGAERRVLRGDATDEIPRLVAEARDLVRNLTAMTAAEASLAATLANVQAATKQLAERGALALLLGDEGSAQRLTGGVERTLQRTDALLGRLDTLAANADRRCSKARRAACSASTRCSTRRTRSPATCAAPPSTSTRCVRRSTPACAASTT